MNKINVGIVDLGQRGSMLISTIMACEEAQIVAVCDNMRIGGRRR